MTALIASESISTPTPQTWWATITAHLLPGVPLLLCAVVGGIGFSGLGLPAVWGLLVGVLVVQVPLLLMLMRRMPVVRRRATAPGRAAAIVVVTVVACALLPGAVAWLEPAIRAAGFAWLPTWSSAGVPDLASLPAWQQAITIGLWLAGPVIAGPIAEELYFRGALLPRIPAGPVAAALVNAVLFAAYHLWQPWALLTVALFALPIAVARARFGATPAMCAVAHCTVNLLAFVAMIGGMSLGR